MTRTFSYEVDNHGNQINHFFKTRSMKIAPGNSKINELKRKCSIVSSASPHTHMGESRNLNDADRHLGESDQLALDFAHATDEHD